MNSDQNSRFAPDEGAMVSFLQQVMNVAQDMTTVWNQIKDPKLPPGSMALKAHGNGFDILLVTSMTSGPGFCEARVTAEDIGGVPAVIKLPTELAVQLRTHVLALIPVVN